MNQALIDKILSNIPKNIKPVQYLIDLLGLSNESVYRRLRGEIPFTFEEITKLSLNLGFSVDEIIGQNKEKRVFFDLPRNTSPENTCVEALKSYHTYLKSNNEVKNAECIATMNKLWFVFSIGYEHLFKFNYYKWIHLNSRRNAEISYADFVVPEEIMDLYHTLINTEYRLGNTTYILSRSIFLNSIKFIQYYYKGKLISKEELSMIQDDLHRMIRDMEKLTQEGRDQFGNNFTYYLSTFDIHSNTFYKNCDGIPSVNFWIYSLQALTIQSPDICSMQKKWIDSLKKYSILISESNEFLQIDFFKKQHQYIEDITSVDYNKIVESDLSLL